MRTQLQTARAREAAEQRRAARDAVICHRLGLVLLAIVVGLVVSAFYDGWVHHRPALSVTDLAVAVVLTAAALPLLTAR